MDSTPKTCPECHAKLADAPGQGLLACPACGHQFGAAASHDLPSLQTSPRGGPPKALRPYLWAAFVCFLIVPPALFLLLTSGHKKLEVAPVIMLLAGAVLAGGTLARLVARKTIQFVLFLVVFSLSFLLINGTLAVFIGCMTMFK